MDCFVEIVLLGTHTIPTPIIHSDKVINWEPKDEGYKTSFYASPEFICRILENLRASYSIVLFRVLHVSYNLTIRGEAYTNDIEGDVFPEKYFYEGVAICYKDTDKEAIEYLNESLDILANISESYNVEESEYLTLRDVPDILKVPVKQIGSFSDIHWIEE